MMSTVKVCRCSRVLGSHTQDEESNRFAAHFLQPPNMSDTSNAADVEKIKAKKGRKVQMGNVDVIEFNQKVSESPSGSLKLGMSWRAADRKEMSLAKWDSLRRREGRLERNQIGNRKMNKQFAENAQQKKAELHKNSPKCLDAWHIKPDGCVHVDVLAAIQGKNVGSTSIVVDVDGRHVKTQNGSVYMLGTLDANISSVLERVGFKIDQDNPLTVDSAEPLLYAERVVYGKAGQLANQAVSILYELQSVLEEPRTNGTFDSIFECLQTIGFDVTPKKPSRE